MDTFTFSCYDILGSEPGGPGVPEITRSVVVPNPDEVAELIIPGGGPGVRDGAPPPDGEEEGDTVSEPGKVIRIGSMLKQLLDEVRQAPLDEASRERMKEIYEISVHELATGLSGNLASELGRISFPFGDQIPSEAELRVAQAQLVGWLEGLFHGIQATLFAQQMAARSQLEQMRERGLPPGRNPGETGIGPSAGPYL